MADIIIFIKLIIRGVNDSEDEYTVDVFTELRELMKKYCKDINCRLCDAIFTFGNHVLNGTETPESLGLANFAVITYTPLRIVFTVIYNWPRKVVIKFKMLYDERFGRFKRFFCGNLYLSMDDVKWYYDGKPIGDEDTPRGLGMNNREAIVAHISASAIENYFDEQLSKRRKPN